MANDSTVRFRQGEAGFGQRFAGQEDARSTGEDPLAELARLIGQEDPFAEFFGESKGPAAAPRPAPPVEREPVSARPGYPERPSYPERPAYSERPSYPERPSFPDRAEPRAPVPPRPEAVRERLAAVPRIEPAPAGRVPLTAAPPPVSAAFDDFDDPAEAEFAPPRPRALDRGREPRLADRAAEAVAEALRAPHDVRRPVPAPSHDAPPPRTPPSVPAFEAPVRPAPVIPAYEAMRPAPVVPAYEAPVRPALRPSEPDLGAMSRRPADDELFAPRQDPATRDVEPDEDDGGLEQTAYAGSAAVYDYSRTAYEPEDDADDLREQDEGYAEFDEDAENRRVARARRSLFLALALVGVGMVVGTGVYAYRALTDEGSSAVATGDTPTIRADQAPSKMVPEPTASATGGDGQKLIYDRVGSDGVSGTERVVSREEQPVDVNQAGQPQPRIILPASGAPSPSPAAPAPLGAMPAAGADPSAPVPPGTAPEPKRVRTLTVRADGSVVTGPAPAPAAPPLSASPPVATAAAPASDPVVQTAAPANVPLPPVRAPAPAAAPAAAAAPQRVAAAPIAAAPAAVAGGYVVQIAAQRSEAEAQTAWRSTQARFPGILGSYRANIRRADLGTRGIYYRAQVGPFAGRDQANELCQSLRAQGGECMVQKN